MKQKLLILLALLMLCVLFVSCSSILNYADSSSTVVDSPETIIAGHIVSEKNAQKQHTMKTT